MTFKAARVLLIAALVALVASVAGCGNSDDAPDTGGGGGSTQDVSSIPAKPESGTFNMGIQPWIGYGPWWIAEKEGIFQREGLDVKLTNFTTDDQVNAAIASGRLEGANVATHTALRLAAAGLPIKIVLLEDVSTTADALLAGKGIDAIDKLKGKRIAYEEGTTSDILLQYALTANGMSIGDIKKVPLPASDAGAAAIAGRVDAAVTYEPYLSSALKQDDGFSLLYTAGEKPGLISDVFIVSEDAIKEKPGQIAALLRAWEAAVTSLKADPAKGQATIAKAVGAEVDSLTTAFKGVEFFPLDRNRSELGPNGAYVTDTIVDVHDAASDAKLIEGDVDSKALVDATFVTASK